MITLDLPRHMMEIKYPHWWRIHQAARIDGNQGPDIICPICRAEIGAEEQDRLRAKSMGGQ